MDIIKIEKNNRTKLSKAQTLIEISQQEESLIIYLEKKKKMKIKKNFLYNIKSFKLKFFIL